MPTAHHSIVKARKLHRPWQWEQEDDPFVATPDDVAGGDFWFKVSATELRRRTDANDDWDVLIPYTQLAHTLDAADVTDFAEAVDDRLATLLVAGSGITLTYDDAAGTLTVVNTASLTDEDIDDAVAALLIAGDGTTIAYDDAGNTLTISMVSTPSDEQIDDRAAALLVAGTNIALTYDDGAGTLTIDSTAVATDEDIDDEVAALLHASSGISLSYDDAGNTLTLSNTGILTNEAIDDRVAALLAAGTGIGLSYDDAGDALTISNSGILDNEAIDDRVAALLVAGSNVTLTYNDAGDALTIAAATITVTDEYIQDLVATELVAGTNITLTYNDGANTLTIDSNPGGGTGMVDPTTTKGDLIVHGGSTTRLPAGTDGYGLTADSAQSLGVKYGNQNPGDPSEFTKVIQAMYYQQGDTTLGRLGFQGGASATGTNTAELDDNGGWFVSACGATNGSSCFIAPTVGGAPRGVTAGQKLDVRWTIATGDAITNYRINVGLADVVVTAAEFNASSGNAVGFSYDSAAHGTAFWRAAANNGVLNGQTVVTTSIAIAAATTYNMRITADDATSYKLYINDTLVATMTTSLPADGTLMGFYVYIRTAEAVSKNVRFRKLVQVVTEN